MDVELIRADRTDDLFDAPAEGGDLAILTERRRARGNVYRAVESDAVDRLRAGRRRGVARAGQADGFPALLDLRLDDGAGPECVAALQRQAMVEDVEDAHRSFPLPRQT